MERIITIDCEITTCIMRWLNPNLEKKKQLGNPSTRIKQIYKTKIFQKLIQWQQHLKKIFLKQLGQTGSMRTFINRGPVWKKLQNNSPDSFIWPFWVLFIEVINTCWLKASITKKLSHRDKETLMLIDIRELY